MAFSQNSKSTKQYSFWEHEAELCIDYPRYGETTKYTCDSIVYSVSSPASCPAEGCGLIFDIHGYTMDAAKQNDNTGLSEKGPQD